MSATIIPCLSYRDAKRMIEWLCATFGFERHAVYEDKKGGIAHADLKHKGADSDYRQDGAHRESACDGDRRRPEGTADALSGRKNTRVMRRALYPFSEAKAVLERCS